MSAKRKRWLIRDAWMVLTGRARRPMTNPEDFVSWADRLKKVSPVSEVVDFCDAVIGYFVSDAAKVGAERKQKRCDYLRDYMKKISR